MSKEKLIQEYKSNIKFKHLCVSLISCYWPFSNDQIVKYKDTLDFKALNSNPNIIWDINTLEATKKYFDWENLWKTKGIELNLDFFKKYKEYIKIYSVSTNKNIDWSFQLLDTYSDLWDWKWLMSKSIVAHPRNIKKYKENYDWHNFSSNRYLNLTDDLLETYKDLWNWSRLSRNANLKLDKKGIEKYKDVISFSDLSRNPSMVPFILAFPDEYEWNWRIFISNPGVVFGDKLISFLISKLKSNHPILKKASEEAQIDFAISSLLSALVFNNNIDREIWFSKAYIDKIPWKDFIKHKPEILTSQEIESHINLEEFDKSLSYRIIQKLSKDFILKNYNLLLKFKSELFRNANIDEDFVQKYAEPNDYYQMGHNTKFDWSLDFVINNLKYYDPIYRISQNQTLYNKLFSNFNEEEIFDLLDLY